MHVHISTFCCVLWTLSPSTRSTWELANMDNVRHIAWTSLSHAPKRYTGDWPVYRLGPHYGMAKASAMATNSQRPASHNADLHHTNCPVDGAELSCFTYLHSGGDR